MLGSAEIGVGEGVVRRGLDQLKIKITCLFPLLFGDGKGPFFGDGGDFGRQRDIPFNPSQLEWGLPCAPGGLLRGAAGRGGGGLTGLRHGGGRLVVLESESEVPDPFQRFDARLRNSGGRGFRRRSRRFLGESDQPTDPDHRGNQGARREKHAHGKRNFGKRK